MDYVVTAAEEGRKLRDILRRSMGVSYSAMKSAKWDGRILLNGGRCRVDAIVHAGDCVTMRWAEDMPVYHPVPYALPLQIPFEDEWLMVVDKPAPLASQSSLNHPNNSLENAVCAYLGAPSQFVYRPVNRLDKGTSGLMVIAKTPHSQHMLQGLLHTTDFTRRYLAVTEGMLQPASGVIDLPIAKEEAASIRRVIAPEGKSSVTRYETLSTRGNRSLVRLTLDTGRTHQIRVHLSAMGCPICGDFLYGTELDALPGRFALHSAELVLRHPFTGAVLTITSPLPACLAALLDG